MACTILLSDQLNLPSPGGYYIYLGYNVESQINASINTPGDNGDLCFGITDPLTDSTPSLYADVGPLNGLDANAFISGTPSPTIDFTGVTPGFYGFMYIVGDDSDNGIIDGIECGDVECFEIEVIAGPSAMSTCNEGADDPCLSICESNLPTDPVIDLTSFFDVDPAVAGAPGFIAGGSWEHTGGAFVTLNGNDATILAGAPIGTIVFTYTILPTELGAVHPPDGDCDDCTSIVTVTIQITEQLSAGEGSSLAVCN